MAGFADLQRTVQATLASKRIGQPVFVRCTLQGKDDSAAIVPRLAALTMAVQTWLGQPLHRLFATGKVADGQVSLLLQFRDGASAQLSYARTQPHGDGLDLMILGNRGAIYHDAGGGDLWDLPFDPGAADAPYRAAIERSLQSGRPEPVGGGAKP